MRDSSIVILHGCSVDEFPELMGDLLQAGAHGYVFKSDLSADLVSAVEVLSQHDLFFTSRLAHMMYQEYVKRRVAPEELDSRRPLTVRQEKCCRFWRRGKATRR